MMNSGTEVVSFFVPEPRMLAGLPDFSNTDSYGTETESISRSKVTLAVIVLLLLTNHENQAF